MSSETRLVLWQPRPPSDVFAHHCSNPKDFNSFVLPILRSLKVGDQRSFEGFYLRTIAQIDIKNLSTSDLIALVSGFSKLNITPFNLCMAAITKKNHDLAMALVKTGILPLHDRTLASQLMAYAFINRNFEVFKALAVARPELVNEMSFGNTTALFQLCQMQDDEGFETLQFLLTLLPGINLQGTHCLAGMTLFERAIASGNIKIAYLLMTSGADTTIVKRANCTLLHVLCQSASDGPEAVALAKELLKSGLEVNELNGEGLTPLMLACKNEKCPSQLIRFLVEKIMSGEWSFNVTDANGLTAFMHLCLNDNCPLDLIRFFFKHFMWIEITPQQGDSILALVAKKGDIPKVKLLVSYKADIHKKDSENLSPLKRACHNHDAPLVTALLGESEAYARGFVADFLARANLVHVNSLTHLPTPGIYEGYFTLEMTQNVLRWLEEFPESLSTDLTPDQRATLSGAFRTATTPPKTDQEAEDLAALIRNKNLVIIPIGFKHHAMYLVFGKGYMTVINRGGGAISAVHTVENFKINARAMTKDMVQRIIAMKEAEKTTALDFYLKELPGALAALADGKPIQDEVCRELEFLYLCLQKNGNCTFSAAKGALRIGAAILKITEDGKGTASLSEKDASDAKNFSHLVSTFIRMRTLSGYMQAHPHPEADIFCERSLLEQSRRKTLSHVVKTPTKAVLETYLKLGLDPIKLFVDLLDKNKIDQARELIEIAKLNFTEIAPRALFQACQGAKINAIEELLKANPDLAKIVDSDGNTPLMWIPIYVLPDDHVKQVCISFQRCGLDINHADKRGMTALMIVASKGTKETIEALVSCGADLSRENEDGDTALILACTGHTNPPNPIQAEEMVEYLISKKVSVDHVNKKGVTALMKVCERGGLHMSDVVEMLLKNGADATRLTLRGETALSFLYRTKQSSGQKSMLDLLLEHHSPLNLANLDGQLPLAIARQNPVFRKDLIEFLVLSGAHETA